MSDDPFPTSPDLPDLEGTTAIAAVTADKLGHAGEQAVAALDHPPEVERTHEAEGAPPPTPVTAQEARRVVSHEAAVEAPSARPAGPSTAASDAAGPLDLVVDYNAKAFAAMRASAAETFEFLAALTGVKSLSEAVALNTAHLRKQVERATAQGAELSKLTSALARNTGRLDGRD